MLPEEEWASSRMIVGNKGSFFHFLPRVSTRSLESTHGHRVEGEGPHGHSKPRGGRNEGLIMPVNRSSRLKGSRAGAMNVCLMHRIRFLLHFMGASNSPSRNLRQRFFSPFFASNDLAIRKNDFHLRCRITSKKKRWTTLKEKETFQGRFEFCKSCAACS